MAQFIIIVIVGFILLLSSASPEAILFGIVILSIIAFIFNRTILLGIIASVLIIGVSVYMFKRDFFRRNKSRKKEMPVEEEIDNEPINISENTVKVDNKQKEKLLKTLITNEYALNNYIDYYQNLCRVEGNLVKIDRLFYGFVKACYELYISDNYSGGEAESKEIFQKVLNKNKILTEVLFTYNYNNFYNKLYEINNDSYGERYIKEYKNYIKINNIDTGMEVRENIAFLTLMYFTTMSLAIKIYQYGENEYMNKKQYIISLEEYEELRSLPEDNEYIVYYDIDSYQFNNITEREKIDYLIKKDEIVRSVRERETKSSSTLGTYNLKKIIERMLISIENCKAINQKRTMELVLKNIKLIEDKAKENKIKIQSEISKKEKKNKTQKVEKKHEIINDEQIYNAFIHYPNILYLYKNLIDTNKEKIEKELNDFSNRNEIKKDLHFKELFIEFISKILKYEEEKNTPKEIILEINDLSFLKDEDINNENVFLEIYDLSKTMVHAINMAKVAKEFDDNIELSKMYQNLISVTRDTKYITNKLYPIYQKFYTKDFENELSFEEFEFIIAIKNNEDIEIDEKTTIKTQKGIIKYVATNFGGISKDNEGKCINLICNLLLNYSTIKEKKQFDILINIDRIIEEINQNSEMDETSKEKERLLRGDLQKEIEFENKKNRKNI